jgi:hypothetical protein
MRLPAIFNWFRRAPPPTPADIESAAARGDWTAVRALGDRLPEDTIPRSALPVLAVAYADAQDAGRALALVARYQEGSPGDARGQALCQIALGQNALARAREAQWNRVPAYLRGGLMGQSRRNSRGEVLEAVIRVQTDGHIAGAIGHFVAAMTHEPRDAVLEAALQGTESREVALIQECLDMRQTLAEKQAGGKSIDSYMIRIGIALRETCLAFRLPLQVSCTHAALLAIADPRKEMPTAAVEQPAASVRAGAEPVLAPAEA